MLAAHSCIVAGHTPGVPGLIYSCTLKYSPLVSSVEATTVYLHFHCLLPSYIENIGDVLLMRY